MDNYTFPNINIYNIAPLIQISLIFAEKIPVLILLNMEVIDKIIIDLRNINTSLSIYDYFNIVPIEKRYVNSIIQIEDIGIFKNTAYLDSFASSSKNLKVLFDHYIEYFDLRNKFKDQIRDIKHEHLNHNLIYKKNDDSKKNNEIDKLYLEDLKLIITLFTAFSNNLDSSKKCGKTKSKFTGKNTDDKACEIYKSNEFSIAYFLFSLFINIYINKFNEKHLENYSIATKFKENSKLFLTKGKGKGKDHTIKYVIHNIRLPIYITKFYGTEATFLMMIVQLLPYLKNIKIIIPIINNILPQLQIIIKEQYYMLLTLIIIFQKRSMGDTDIDNFIQTLREYITKLRI